MARLSPRRAALQQGGRRNVPGLRQRPRPMGLHNPSNLPYDGADYFSQHTQQWFPSLWSGDTTIGPFQRDTLVARIRDLVRNDGWASGAVTRVLDSTVGVSLRPVSKPDHRWLRHVSGNSRFDASWAAEFGSFVDAHWRNWADDPARHNDTERQLTFSQQMHLAMRHLLTDGDCLAILPWMEDRVSLGRGRYATTVQIVDTDRLSNPNSMYDLDNIRNGVEIDMRTGSPVAYHIREAHQADWFQAGRSVTWRRFPKEDEYGTPLVVHHFERHQAGQHRGGAGIFAPVITRMKMLARYDTAELDAAIVNAVFAAFIETPYDPAYTAEALGAPNASTAFGDSPAGWGAWDERVAYNEGRNLSLQGSRIPMLSPGEKITAVDSVRPSSSFEAFEKTVLRNVASAAGLSPMQVSNDWSDVNYSSARGALLEAWKTTDRRRMDFCTGFAAPIRLAWLEECMESDSPPLPSGSVPRFLEARHAYGRAKWLGPGRGWIDPTKEREGSLIGIQAGLSTLEDEAAANEGRNWEDVLDQRAVEKAAFEKAGLTLPGDLRADIPSGPEDSENAGDSNA